MGIVNVTPDSFSDGGRFLAGRGARPSTAVVLGACARWVEAGVDIIDVGGESTRPGAEPVGPQEELDRVLPVLKALRADPRFHGVAISIDTRRAAVAEASVRAGADIINDISGLADPLMAKAAAASGVGLVISHLRGEPRTMQSDVRFDDLLTEVADELRQATRRAVEQGVHPSSIVIDPGIGFGKHATQSAALTLGADELRSRVGYPVLIGASRKSFLGAITDHGVEQRSLSSIVAAVLAVVHGASIVRVHDVAETLEALRVESKLSHALRHHSMEARRG
jgi:dihydropteroate synthase